MVFCVVGFFFSEEFGVNFKEYGYGGYYDSLVKIFGIIFLFLCGCFVNFWIMDEKIICLCEENNVFLFV